MAKIDTFLEMVTQKQVSKAIISGNKPFVLWIGNQKADGTVISASQLEQLLQEVMPEHLKPQMAPENRQGSVFFNFNYTSPAGSFHFAVELFAGDLQLTVTPQKEQVLAPSPQTPHGAIRPESSFVCQQCGMSLPPSAVACENCGALFGSDRPAHLSTLEFMDGNGTRAEILQYDHLNGFDDTSLAAPLFYAHQIGVRLKQVKITLNGGSVVAEAGALHFMKGHVSMDSPVGGIEGLAKKLASNMLTKETMFKPRYTGKGEIYLEPTFGHFILMRLDNEEMIVDKGMFYVAESTIEVGIAAQKNISSALFGGEGFFQTRLAGTGWCVLCSPVSPNEIIRYKLNNDRLCVDGNFALLRKGAVNFTVERSTKSLLGNFTSGEGALQTFSGTGEVWIAPTQSVYNAIKYRGLNIAPQGKGSSGSNT